MNRLGKIPIEVLQNCVFNYLGTKRNDVVVGPSVGEDAAIVKAGEEILAIATDPVTGAAKRIGWLAVHVNANDVATCGIQPRWFTSCILLPKGSTEELVERICRQIDKAVRQLNMAVITGHCEITPHINNPIVIGCSIGVAENGYVTSKGAKPGDKIVLTKGAGIEGTAILASDRRNELLKMYDETFIKNAENFFERISVVNEAIIAFKTGGVKAMHDPTEGGIVGGLHELADAANVGFQVYEEAISVLRETEKICTFFKIDPLQLISSGSLLIVTENEKTDEIVRRLSQNGIHSSIIGNVTKPDVGRKMVTKKGEIKELIRPISDQLWLALERSVKNSD